MKASLRLRVLFLPLIGLVVASAVNCHYGSGLFVSGGNPPTFEIRRSRSAHVRIFPIFIVTEIHPDNEHVPPLQEDEAKNRDVWKITSGPGNADFSEKIERIEYGKVPPGYMQEIPKEGAAEQLQENKLYEARGPLSLMGDAVVRFTIVDGRVTMQPHGFLPRHNLYATKNRWVRSRASLYLRS